MMNAMGLPNPGIEAYREEVEIFKDGIEETSIMIGSVFGATIEEYGEAARRTEEIGVDAIEINGSCPNARGLGLQFGQDPDVIKELVSVVKSRVSIPVFFKLTPNTHDIVSLAFAAQEGGADGLVAINTIQAMTIDVHSRRPVLTNVTGGLSGPAIKPVGVRCVYAIASDKRIKIPIIAVGGATNAEDVLEYMIAGASAVQVGTAVTWSDLDVFTQMEEGIRRYLIENDIERIEEIIGSVKGVMR
jgi:dihydroorotate dehydrogenase (NAD+) catalytic subunit